MTGAPPQEVSSPDEVRGMYDAIAESYAEMMDDEIELPIIASTLEGLADSLRDVRGPVLDSSCGTGHLLERYRAKYDPTRDVLGVDLSKQMVNLTRDRLANPDTMESGASVSIRLGDMRDLGSWKDASIAGVISFFALHHLDAAEVPEALREWRRVLVPEGRLLLATWEGTDAIDYGDSASIVAVRHAHADLVAWLERAGFQIETKEERFEEEMGMNSLYLRARAKPL